MHAVSFSGDLKDYLLKLDLTFAQEIKRQFCTTILHVTAQVVKNACIHAHQMEIKQADN